MRVQVDLDNSKSCKGCPFLVGSSALRECFLEYDIEQSGAKSPKRPEICKEEHGL